MLLLQPAAPVLVVTLEWLPHRFVASSTVAHSLNLAFENLSYPFGSPVDRDKQVRIDLFNHDLPGRQLFGSDVAALVDPTPSTVDV